MFSTKTFSSALPSQIDLAIVGAGPHALTLVAHLLQKRQQMQQRFIVFDPSGNWMAQWQKRFAALEIPHLRSPAVHHPDANPFALRAFAESRSTELHPPYDLPGTQLFQDFCHTVSQRWQLQERVYPAQVTDLEAIAPRRFQLSLSDGQSVLAKRVVIADGGGGKPQIPDWVSQISTPYPGDRLLHSSQIDLRGLQLRGERILIVGGGLTSGHLALGAIVRGAEVILMTRRQLFEKLFDADPGWLGPKYLKDFWAEPDWEKRWQMIQQARNGGSLTPAVLTQLRRLCREGKITFYEHCQIAQAEWQEGWKVCCDNHAVHDCIHQTSIDRIWLSTGTTLNAVQHPLLQNVLKTYPTPIIKGLPLLDDHLRWQGCELFVMGGLAALRVGPSARNLSGARMASDRIVPALVKSSVARSVLSKP
jgi:cation diffusion facilitator CzcD-associated flavoprotein CzcO